MPRKGRQDQGEGGFERLVAATCGCLRLSRPSSHQGCAEVWEMPPEEAPNVAPSAREDIIDRLTRFEMENSLEVASSPKVSVRRMNRFQYNNAVVDLLDLQGVVYALPERILRDHDGYFQPQTGKCPRWSRSAADRWVSRSS